MITIKQCPLVGIGMFYQGSGFTKEEAQNIADLLNKQAAEREASIAALYKPEHGGRSA